MTVAPDRKTLCIKFAPFTAGSALVLCSFRASSPSLRGLTIFTNPLFVSLLLGNYFTTIHQVQAFSSLAGLDLQRFGTTNFRAQSARNARHMAGGVGGLNASFSCRKGCILVPRFLHGEVLMRQLCKS